MGKLLVTVAIGLLVLGGCDDAHLVTKQEAAIAFREDREVMVQILERVKKLEDAKNPNTSIKRTPSPSK